jgi:DnaJ family protein C protein 7
MLQAAASADSAAPPKTLLRLARCQLALAQTEAALSTLGAVLAADPANAPAVQMRACALELEVYARNLVTWRDRGMWDMARIELEKCLHAIEAEGNEIPTAWRQWHVDIKRNGNSAAEYVPPLFSYFSLFAHFLGCPLSLLIFSEALRLKEEGNQAFKLGKLHEALSRYTDALEVRS